VLDELEEDGLINQGSHQSKSAHIYNEGLEQARALLEKYG
jgi:thymidylate synthase